MAEENGRTWSADVKDLGDKIVTLTVAKAVELGDYMEQVHKIKPAASAVAMMPGAGGGGVAVAEKPAEQTEFTVVLEGFDAAKKINVIKIVREITGLGLKEAKDLVEGAPKPVKENVSKDEGAKLKAKLEEGGAKVSLK
ncbi:MAG TPA: 50S ribosomal protein L7/L12 [Gemmataceae bacterium]|jgi:large subunit ribosomal protein L7/L12|nr:50S ribosomal protein L7/L12 [Gemmataceae bacterium]